MELQTVISGGASISTILELPEPYDKELSIRLLSPLIGKAGDEIYLYYQSNLPLELDLALKSSGNLHNPAMEPLSS